MENPADLMQLAASVLADLQAQGIPPTPSNYTERYIEAARSAGFPPSLIQRWSISNMIAVPVTKEAEGEGLAPALDALLLLLLVGVASVDEELSGRIEALRSRLAAPRPDAAEVLADVEALSAMLGPMLVGLADQRDALKEVIGLLMAGVGTLLDGSGDFASQLEAFAEKVRATESLTDVVSLVDAVASEAESLSRQTLAMRTEFEAVNERVRTANRHISDLQGELLREKSLALRDPLTGIPNRRGFELWSKAHLSLPGERWLPFAAIMFDVDKFKAVNDTYGHLAGDRVLVELARRIRAATRDGDFACRHGGEEFTVTLPGAPMAAAQRIAERILASISGDDVDTGATRLRITASAGVALHRPGESPSATLDRADAALYLAKTTGRNRVCTEDELS